MSARPARLVVADDDAFVPKPVDLLALQGAVARARGAPPVAPGTGRPARSISR